MNYRTWRFVYESVNCALNGIAGLDEGPGPERSTQQINVVNKETAADVSLVRQRATSAATVITTAAAADLGLSK